MEWAERAQQTLPWTIIANAADAKAFADKLDAAPIFSARRTSISTALSTAGELLAQSGVAATRMVIDVSGDGANNSGAPVESVRDEILARNIVINGLPIMREGSTTSSWMDVPDLDRYYKDCVVGGPGSFSLPVRTIDELQRTIRAKMVSEIAGLTPPRQEQGLFKLAQAQRAPKTNCLIGEQRRGGNFDFGSPPPPMTPLSPGNQGRFTPQP
jgi:hypothetical protein